MPHIKLTPEIEQQIVAGIRTGGYPHIAAEAAGVPRELFERWLQLGKKNRKSAFRSFWLNVQQACAQARLKVEVDARAKDAKFWLHYGPGKETLDNPGWSASAKPAPRDSEDGNPFHDRLFMSLLAKLVDAL